MDEAHHCRDVLAKAPLREDIGIKLTRNCGNSDAPVEPTPILRITCDSQQEIAAKNNTVSGRDSKEDELDCRCISI
jgi:hypothetical protein